MGTFILYVVFLPCIISFSWLPDPKFSEDVTQTNDILSCTLYFYNRDAWQPYSPINTIICTCMLLLRGFYFIQWSPLLSSARRLDITEILLKRT